MSQENVEQENVRVVLEGFAGFNADEGGLEWRLRMLPETMATFGQPDWEYHTDSRDPDSAIHRGRDAVTRHFAGWLEAYPDLKTEPVEAKASGDKVFVWLRFSGHGAEARSRLRWNWRTSSPCGTASGREQLSTRTRPKPSKPPGCRSRA